MNRRLGMAVRVREVELTEDPVPSDPELGLIFRKLRAQEALDDAYFDRIYPEWARKSSQFHWTPVAAAIRAVQFITQDQPEARILDVGAGAGKFCLVGASISKARFEGVEQRIHLVTLSRALLSRYQIPRVTFNLGDFIDQDWSKYDAVYLYNPFEEHRSPEHRVDSTVHLERSRFANYVNFTYFQLAKLAIGSRVMTYCGFGGAMPPSYRKIFSEHFKGPLECWVKEK